jgi:RimJ/RimL family protein N-acetyltransferase
MLLQVSARVSLRPFRHSDASDLVSGLNDWQVARWLASVPHPYRVDHAKAYLARPEHRSGEAALDDKAATLALAITLNGCVIGGMGLVPSKRYQGARELGFWLSRRFWGQGIMPRAASALIDEVMRQAPDTLIVASANHDNFRSQGVIRSLGFVRDGDDEIFSNPLQRLVMTVCYRRP